MFSFLIIFITYLISTTTGAIIIKTTQDFYDKILPTQNEKLLKENKNFWYEIGNSYLEKKLKLEQEPKKFVAKNVVIMIGDGMGIQTITATRIYKGQGMGKSGEDHNLIYDNFPHLGLVKTYNVDMQTPDSAGTATAIFTGVKTRYESIGVDVEADRHIPDPKIFQKSQVDGIMDWAQEANKDTGIVTTTRITHATPAASYAHVHFREWECDSEIPQEFKPFVKDIARQLIEDAPGNKFKVILGGGYQQLGYITEDLSDGECIRNDNLNLTKLWLENHKNQSAAFITNNEQLQTVGDVDYLLGLFNPDHLPYDLLRDKSSKGTPSLSELTKKSLDILKKSKDGFVLLVEGGRIDHGHHKNYARLALAESAEFEKTISLVVNETDSNTLIIVTADHSHSMTLNGYSKRGNDILGYTRQTKDHKPTLTLTYANGPGFTYHYSPNVSTVLWPWIDVRNDTNRLNNPKYQHLGSFEVDDETHGGEDVGIFALGPNSHLISGVIEQNYIAHMISYSSCIGPRANMNPYCKNIKSGSEINRFNLFFLISILITKFNLFFN